MRVALNAHLLSRAQTFRSGGISRYIDGLLRELARDPRGHTYHVYLSEAPVPDDPLRGGALRFETSGPATERPAARIAWEQTVFPARLAVSRPDLVHHLAYAAPLAATRPGVLTIYDLSFLRFPRAFNAGNRLYLSAITRLSARRARRVLTISEHSRQDITQLLRVPPERIDLTYPGVDARYRPLAEDEVTAFRAAHDVPDAFVFTLGTLEPRKNLAGLLDAYARLPRGRPPLYVAGAAGWRYSPIFEQVRRLGLDQDVRFLGFVSEEQLPLWYNAARLFAYPSLYEGFGLPVLEAMACGTPVVTSNAASLPEVAGRAATTVSPTDVAGLAEAMGRALEDDRQRATMRAAGLIQASRFTWSIMADQTVVSYERACAT